MTLLITVTAAVACTILWYFQPKRREYRLSFLCFMFWGASIMWLVDAIFEFAELGAEYFMPSIEDMINDSFLGLSVVALGLVVWVILLLIKDPNGVVRKTLTEK